MNKYFNGVERICFIYRRPIRSNMHNLHPIRRKQQQKSKWRVDEYRKNI